MVYPMTNPILLTEVQVEAEYGVPRRTLQALRYRGGGMPFAKVGASVYYRREDIDAWINANMRTSTSDTGAGVRQ